MKKIFSLCLCLFALYAQAQDDANNAYVDSLFQQLPEVMIRGERPVVKAERGKLVYDLPRLLDKLPVSNAYEAVKELPGVLEQNGTLTLGGQAVTLVLNGKVSTLGKEDLRTVLEATPVSRLEKAEVMYAAPARYHIRGAMINVVLKSAVGQRPSLSGEVAGTYTQSRRADVMGRGSLLYTSKRLSADLMYSYGYRRSAWGLEKQSWHTMDGQVYELDLHTKASGSGGRHNARLGLDYDLGNKNNLSLVYNAQYRYGTDCTTMRGTADSDKRTDGHRQLHNLKADYRSSFGLSAGMDFLFFESPEQSSLRKVMQGAEQQLTDENCQRINRWLLYLNQVHTLADKTELNYGVKYTTTHDNSYQWQRDDYNDQLIPDNSVKELRKEYTLNLYGGASHSFGKKLSAEVSLATELYHARARHSWMCYPTLNLTYTPADGHTLQTSFTSDREYPDYWQLQPIVQYVDSYTEAHGNPDLRPSSDYSVDLGYLYRNKYMLGVNYDYTPDYFVQLPYQLPDRLAEVNQVVNYDFRRRWTLRAMTSYHVGQWWKGRFFVFGIFSHDKNSCFHDVPFDRHKFSIVFNTTNTFIISKRPNLTGSLTGFYQSRAIQGVYNISPLCNISASLQWTSPNGKARVMLKGNDLFQTSNMTTRLDWGLQQNRTDMNWDRRSLTVFVSYKLGGYKEKKREEVDTRRLGK